MLNIQEAIRSLIQEELNKNTQGLDFEVSLYNVKTNDLLEKTLPVGDTYATQQRRFIPVLIEEISGEYADLQNLTASEVFINLSLLIPVDDQNFNNIVIEETYQKVALALDELRIRTNARKLPLGEPILQKSDDYRLTILNDTNMLSTDFMKYNFVIFENIDTTFIQDGKVLDVEIVNNKIRVNHSGQFVEHPFEVEEKYLIDILKFEDFVFFDNQYRLKILNDTENLKTDQIRFSFRILEETGIIMEDENDFKFEVVNGNLNVEKNGLSADWSSGNNTIEKDKNYNVIMFEDGPVLVIQVFGSGVVLNGNIFDTQTQTGADMVFSDITIGGAKMSFSRFFIGENEFTPDLELTDFVDYIPLAGDVSMIDTTNVTVSDAVVVKISGGNEPDTIEILYEVDLEYDDITLGGLLMFFSEISLGSNSETLSFKLDDFVDYQPLIGETTDLDLSQVTPVYTTGDIGSMVFGYSIPNPTTNQFTMGNGLNYQQFELNMTGFMTDTVFVGNEVKYFLNDVEIFPFYRDETFVSETDSSQVVGQQITKHTAVQSILGREYSIYYKNETKLTELAKKITSETPDPNEVFKFKVEYPFFIREYDVIITQGSLGIANNQPISISVKLDLASNILV